MAAGRCGAASQSLTEETLLAGDCQTGQARRVKAVPGCSWRQPCSHAAPRARSHTVRAQLCRGLVTRGPANKRQCAGPCLGAPLLVQRGRHHLAERGGPHVALLPELVHVVLEYKAVVPARQGRELLGTQQTRLLQLQSSSTRLAAATISRKNTHMWWPAFRNMATPASTAVFRTPETKA